MFIKLAARFLSWQGERATTWEACVACHLEYAYPHLCRRHRLCGVCHGQPCDDA